METLTSAPVAIVLGLIGVAAIFLATWINAVDVALGRMSLAYAEDLEEEGRRNATALRETVASRKGAGLALAVPRGLAQGLGTVLIAAVCLSQFERADIPWWLTLLLTLLVVAFVGTLSFGALNAMLRGDRYVTVALAGAPMANRLLGNTKVLAMKSRKRRHREEEVSEETWSRLDLAEDLLELADEVSEGSPEALEEADREYLRSVLELGQTRIGEVMVPRGEMVTISANKTAEDALSLFVESGFSRIPVIGKNIDDVVGVLYFKDTAKRVHTSPNGAETKVSDLMRTAQFVPEMKLADDELRVMQASNTHLALVVDEYGGIAGLVTVEDILEEVVGELVDEHDRPQTFPAQIGPATWVVSSSYSLDDLADLTDTRIEDDDVYSVGGLLSKAIGKVVLPGAEATVGDLHLRAGDQVGRRKQITTIRVEKIDPQTTEETEGSDEAADKAESSGEQQL